MNRKNLLLNSCWISIHDYSKDIFDDEELIGVNKEKFTVNITTNKLITSQCKINKKESIPLNLFKLFDICSYKEKSNNICQIDNYIFHVIYTFFKYLC